MSLVNDALKRAKEAHDRQAQTPMRGAPLHSATPASAKVGLIIAVAALGLFLALILVGGGIWFWLGRSYTLTDSSKPPPLATASKVVSPPIPVPTPAPIPVAPPKVEPPPPTPPPPPVVIPPASTAAATVVVPIEMYVPPPSPPVNLQLQGILYSAKNPNAIINGRTVRVGDTINGARIAAITADQVTVIFNQQSYVIRLR